ncbi:MAG TPA: hypothetical protein VHW64_16425 [Nocardioides sp.]|uniref:hypothetical protein n=1 Tax=Nocardioides sp. TaxID=35761 RepID=UPI002E35DCB6|nr:hypothetical protein [Nocardioides sp.]HEX3932288.1 hypothetical protein [Nocardioides sp.]
MAEAWAWCLPEAAFDDAPETDTETELDPERRLSVTLREGPGGDPLQVGPSTLSGPDLGAVMDRLTPMVTGLALTAHRSDLVMFHACAVADPETGGAVALYGPSGTGKTTVARTLCTDLVYLSDETAAVDDDLCVVPYPKPLSVLARPSDAVKDQVSPGRLGLVRATDRAYPLRGLLQLRRDPAHVGAAVLEPLSTVEALPELVAQTSFTREMTRPLHRLADLAHRTGGVRRVTYAEAGQLGPVVRAVLDGEA